MIIFLYYYYKSGMTRQHMDRRILCLFAVVYGYVTFHVWTRSTAIPRSATSTRIGAKDQRETSMPLRVQSLPPKSHPPIKGIKTTIAPEEEDYILVTNHPCHQCGGGNTSSSSSRCIHPLELLPSERQRLTYSKSNTVQQILVPTESISESSLAIAGTPRHAQPLVFVHIPKNAGTAMEMVAQQAGIAWGRDLFIHSNNHTSHDLTTTNKQKKRDDSVVEDEDECPRKGRHFQVGNNVVYLPTPPAWHLPPGAMSSYYTCGVYDNADLFAVVRNPYTRLLSQWYYACYATTSTRQCLGKANDAQYMNYQLQRTLRRQLECEMGTVDRTCYLQEDAHYVPQSHFLFQQQKDVRNTLQPQPLQSTTTYSTKSSSLPEKRIVRYILRMEYLAQDFQDLMDLVSTGHVRLPTTTSTADPRHEHPYNYSRAATIMTTSFFSQSPHHQNVGSDNATLTPTDLDNTTLQLLRQLYAHDFELGGYSLELPS